MTTDCHTRILKFLDFINQFADKIFELTEENQSMKTDSGDYIDDLVAYFSDVLFFIRDASLSDNCTGITNKLNQAAFIAKQIISHKNG